MEARAELAMLPEQVVSSRKYDWSLVNRMLAGEFESVTYECGTVERAKSAFLALRSNRACCDGEIRVSRSGSELIVGRG